MGQVRLWPEPGQVQHGQPNALGTGDMAKRGNQRRWHGGRECRLAIVSWQRQMHIQWRRCKPWLELVRIEPKRSSPATAVSSIGPGDWQQDSTDPPSLGEDNRGGRPMEERQNGNFNILSCPAWHMVASACMSVGGSPMKGIHIICHRNQNDEANQRNNYEKTIQTLHCLEITINSK